MRILLIVPALALATACNVTKDEANNTTSVTINEDVAANGLANAGNAIENIASDVGNEASNLGDKVENTDVNVSVNTDVKTENKTK